MTDCKHINLLEITQREYEIKIHSNQIDMCIYVHVDKIDKNVKASKHLLQEYKDAQFVQNIWTKDFPFYELICFYFNNISV